MEISLKPTNSEQHERPRRFEHLSHELLLSSFHLSTKTSNENLNSIFFIENILFWNQLQQSWISEKTFRSRNSIKSEIINQELTIN